MTLIRGSLAWRDRERDLLDAFCLGQISRREFELALWEMGMDADEAADAAQWWALGE